LETAFASDGDIGDAVIKNFEATSITTRRLGFAPSQETAREEMRRLLTTWTVNCDVYVDMSTTILATTSQLESALISAVKSNTFIVAVENTTGILDPTSVLTVAITDSPSKEPSAQPTLFPTHLPSNPPPTHQPTKYMPTSPPRSKGKSSKTDNTVVNASIGAALICFILIAVVFICRKVYLAYHSLNIIA
jgi:hypothetical protein